MRSTIRYALFGILALSLCACTRSGPPAPVVVGTGGTHAAASATATNAPIAPGSVYVARAGDTIFTISRRSGVPTRALIDANRLAPPYALAPGTRVSIPAVRVHEVRAGDTVSQIAQRYGVPLRELVRVNSIEPPYVIRVGQRLALPEGASRTSTASTPPVVAAIEPPSRAPAAPRTSVEAAPLPPPPGAPPATAVNTPVQTAPVVTAPAAPQAASVPQAPSSVAPQPANPPATPPEAPSSATGPVGRMLWPVRGVVVSDYGPKSGGLQNDGINIAAPRGTAFRAAESGIVIYAGNELRGFGNLLLVRHESGYVTAYAHADELSVQRGEQVRRGQTIGRVGSSGNVSSPQLHFEVRRGTRAVNPAEFLGAQTGDAN